MTSFSTPKENNADVEPLINSTTLSLFKITEQDCDNVVLLQNLLKGEDCSDIPLTREQGVVVTNALDLIFHDALTFSSEKWVNKTIPSLPNSQTTLNIKLSKNQCNIQVDDDDHEMLLEGLNILLFPDIEYQLSVALNYYATLNKMYETKGTFPSALLLAGEPSVLNRAMCCFLKEHAQKMTSEAKNGKDEQVGLCSNKESQ